MEHPQPFGAARFASGNRNLFISRLSALIPSKLRAGGLTLADQALVSLVNFSSFFLLAQAMPEVALGEYAVGYTMIMMITAFQQALIGNAYQVKAARLDGAALKRFTTVVMFGHLVLAAGVVALLSAVGGALIHFGFGSYGMLAIVVGFSVAPWLTQDLIRKVFYTRGRASSALLNDTICYGLQLAGVLWLIFRPETPEAWMGLAVYGGASAVAAVVGFVQIRDLLSVAALRGAQWVRAIAREVWDFGKWLAAAQFWQQLGSTGHTWIILLLMGPAALGAYRAAAHLVNVFNPIETALGLWLPSRASQEYSGGGVVGLRVWHQKLVSRLMLPMFLGVIGFVLLADPILHLAYGGRFDGTGMFWVISGLALARWLLFGRNIYQNGLIAADRPDTSLVDSYLFLGLRMGVGIPAVYFLGLLGVPISAVVVSGATWAYNRKMFQNLDDPKGSYSMGWKPVGLGAEGRVYLDHNTSAVTKVYGTDVAPEAAERYYHALKQAAERPDFNVASTPKPIAFEPAIPMIQMESCPGESLARFVESGKGSNRELKSVAERVWTGMRSVPKATGIHTYDLWPDNILYDRESGRLTLLDFVSSGDAVDRSPSLGAHSLGGLLGHMLYDLSRPSRWHRILPNARALNFCRQLTEHALDSGEDGEAVFRITRRVFETCTTNTGSFRGLYYRSLGEVWYRINAWRLLRGMRNRVTTPDRLRVYHFMRDFPEDGVQTANGVHRAVRSLATGLHLSGTHTEVLCEGPIRSIWMTSDGVDVHTFRRRAEKFSGLFLPAGLKAHLSRLPSKALFVIHGQFSPQGARVALALKRQGRPYVLMPHSVYTAEVFQNNVLAKWLYWHVIEKRVLKGASVVQLLDRDQAIPLRERGIRTPVVIVPNAIDHSVSVPCTDLTWSSDGPVRLYFLGRINFHQKGLDLLVRAAARIKDEFDIRLTIQGGDAGDLEELRRMTIQTGADDITTLLPPDFSIPSPTLMAKHDVFCMPSRIEGFPMAALEAMQAGRPLLFTNVSGLTEAIRDSGCGVLVSPTVEDVARGLREICSRREEFQAMGMAGKAYVEEHYSQERVGRIAANAYGAVPKKRAGHRGARPAPDRSIQQTADGNKPEAPIRQRG